MSRKTVLKKRDLTKRDVEVLLGEQTATILGAVDSRLEKVEVRFNKIDSNLEKVEMRFNKKLDQLMTTLDRFLKRLTPLGN